MKTFSERPYLIVDSTLSTQNFTFLNIYLSVIKTIKIPGNLLNNKSTQQHLCKLLNFSTSKSVNMGGINRSRCVSGH